MKHPLYASNRTMRSVAGLPTYQVLPKLRISDRLNYLLSSPISVVFVFAAVSCYLWIFVATIHGRGDEGLLLYPAERILAGQVPYRDFFSELAPGTFYIQSLWFKIFGTHIWSARLPMLLVMAAIASQLFYLSRKIMAPWAATVPILIYSVTALTRWMIVSHHWYSLFFALSATIFLVLFFQKRQTHWLFLAGVSTSASGMCMQSKGVFCLLGATVILAADYLRARCKGESTSLTGLVYYLFGVLAPTTILLYYFYRQEALDELIYSTVTFLWQSYLPYDYQPLPFLPSNLWHGLRAVVNDFSIGHCGKFVSKLAWGLLIPVTAVIYVLRAMVRQKGLGQARDQRVFLLCTYLALGLALMLSEMHRFDFVHMLFGGPLLLVLAVALVYDVGFQRAQASIFASALLVSLILFYLIHGLSLAHRESKRNSPIHTRRGTFYQRPERAARYQAIINQIESRVSPNSETFFYPYAPMLYFLTGTSNPTRFDYLLPGQTTLAHFEEVIRCLNSQQAPRFIFSSWKERKQHLHYLFPNVPRERLQHHPIEQFLLSGESPYRLAFECASFKVFERHNSL